MLLYRLLAFLSDINSVLLVVSWVLQAESSSWYYPSLPEKHFPRVWQLEQNKRLLFASCRSASHNTQLTACSFMIHSQELGVSEIRKINMAPSAFLPILPI